MYFYSHLIKIESLLIKLDELELEPHHKKHLAALVDSTIHTTVLDLILDKLSSEDKKTFLQELSKDPEDKKIMEFLNSKVENIEQEIFQTVEKLKDELHQDITETKRLHSK